MALLFHHHHHHLLFLLLVPLLSEAQHTTSATPPPDHCCAASFSRSATLTAFVFLLSITTVLWYIGICRRRNTAAANRPAKRGLEKTVIDSFAVMLYSAVKELKIGRGTLECAVCLCEFEEDDALRVLPGCSHAFHLSCIDMWLHSHTTCPVCRASLTPGITDGRSTGEFPAHVSVEVEENRPGTSREETGPDEWTEEERERFTLTSPETARVEMMGRSETMGLPARGAWRGRTVGGCIFNTGRKEWAARSDRYALPGRTWLPSPEGGGGGRGDGSAARLDRNPVEVLAAGSHRYL